ncbi:alpha/beta hydrolase [Sphingomonas faeni]|uniref:alpha/beta hydrolase n=1 Tax=Sphingomonas faeni TaxID=185950 RepID=UPI00336053B8
MAANEDGKTCHRAARRPRSRDAARGRSTTAAVLPVFLVLGLLGGCVNPVGRSLYKPTPLGSITPIWTERAPTLVETVTHDGVRLRGWYWPPATTDGAVLIYLPGRGGNRDTAALAAQAFARDGHGLLVASYRGYGDNAGVPDERGLYEDGRAFVARARQLVPNGRRFVFGDGLGSAVALHVAGEAPVAVDAVVTLGAFDSFARFVPGLARGFYADAFDNVAAIRRVTVPVLLLHGRKDEVVPFAAAERLRAAAGGKALVVPIDGEAYHSFDLSHIAPVVWRALDQIAADEAAVAK